MQIYELSYLILPSIPEAELDGVVGKIKALINEAEGKDFDGEMPFKHPLSYLVSKTVGASRYIVNEAYIGWIKFEIESLKILELKSQIEKISEILRFLIVKAPRKTEFTFAKAKALLKAKEDKEKGGDEKDVVTEEPILAPEAVVE